MTTETDQSTQPGAAATELTPEQKRRAKRKGRITLVAMTLVFLSPTLFALFWRPEGRVNHGDLVDPPFELPDLALTTLDGNTVKVSEIRRKWLWATVIDGPCDAGCEQNLYTLRQTRLALGKNAKRVSYAVISLDASPEKVAARMSSIPAAGGDSDHPLMRVYTASGVEAEQLLSRFQELGAVNNIILIDPIGNLILRYPSDSETDDKTAEEQGSLLGKKLKKDLGRLLRGSHIG